MAFLDYLRQARSHTASGTLYKKWAKDNPGEAKRYNAFIDAILVGDNPQIPTMATETGKGLVLFAAGYRSRAAVVSAASLEVPA